MCRALPASLTVLTLALASCGAGGDQAACDLLTEDAVQEQLGSAQLATRTDGEDDPTSCIYDADEGEAALDTYPGPDAQDPTPIQLRRWLETAATAEEQDGARLNPIPGLADDAILAANPDEEPGRAVVIWTTETQGRKLEVTYVEGDAGDASDAARNLALDIGG